MENEVSFDPQTGFGYPAKERWNSTAVWTAATAGPFEAGGAHVNFFFIARPFYNGCGNSLVRQDLQNLRFMIRDESRSARALAAEA